MSKISNNEIILYQPENKGEIILYQHDSSMSIEVRFEDETVWLTQAQMVTLFDSSKANISEHIKHIYDTHELEEIATVRNFRTVRMEGKRKVNRVLEHYCLDMIIAVGYRVNTKQGTQFRIWANRVLKEYLLRGYAISQRIERLEYRVTETERKIGFFVKTSQPPVEGIFYDGQTFDAYVFVADLIKSAKHSITLIDNYVDESVLLLLSKRNAGVAATVYTANFTPQLQLDLQRHNTQYPPITINTFTRSHDRFLIIDNNVYLIGASLKDLGKKWFGFTKMIQDANLLLQNIT